MRNAKPLLLGSLIIAIVVAGFLVWTSSTMGPAPAAIGALRSDAQVIVSLDGYLVFHPASKKPSTGFVFYPGGRVDYRSYAAPLHKIAAEGYLVILPPVRLNLAFFDVNAADRAIADFPAIRHWVVGGHSLGGVAAATYAGRKDGLEGVVFWASYPADDTLKDSHLKVLSIYGNLDMAGVEPFEASRLNLPADAEFVLIKGGNHAQFGDYGFQPGDREAAITRTDQQEQVVDATVKFLKEISE